MINIWPRDSVTFLRRSASNLAQAILMSPIRPSVVSRVIAVNLLNAGQSGEVTVDIIGVGLCLIN